MARTASVLVLSALSACGPAPPPELRPGAGLLDLLGAVRVTQRPATNLPADIGAALTAPLSEDVFELSAADWRDQGPTDPALLELARGVGVASELHSWHAQLDDDGAARLAAGALPYLMRHGRPVEPFVWGRRILTTDWAPRDAAWVARQPDAAVPSEGPPFWVDRGAELLVWWDDAQGLLCAVSPEPPDGLQWRRHPDRTAEVLRWEPVAKGAAGRRTSAAELITPLTWGDTTRRALVLPAPGTLVWPRRVLRGDALELSVGVPDHAFAVEDGAIVPSPGRSDGVSFVVEVSCDGALTEVWRRHVGVAEGLVSAEVSLAAWTDRIVELRLRTEPGPAGDAAFDYGAFCGLRIVGAPARPLERPHIVLIDVDTLRADRLGLFGSTRDTTPRLDAWAARRAVAYTDVMATASWTIPSTASILTGLHVHQHGVAAANEALSPATPSLALQLRDAGYETRAFADLGFVSPSFGFDQGFEQFTATVWEGEEPTTPDWSVGLEWLVSERGEQPRFLFLHTYMVHDPYHDMGHFAEPRPEQTAWLSAAPVGHNRVHGPVRAGTLQLDAAERAALSRIYDEGVRRMDDVVGGFLEQLEVRLDGRPCLVILTSDHGEEFFEHGSLGHGQSLHREVLRVPLLVAWPGEGAPTGFDHGPVSTLDIAPTVLQAAGVTPRLRLPGTALQQGVPSPRPRLAMLDDSFALRFDGWKLIHSGWPEQAGQSWWGAQAALASEHPTRLFHAEQDPGEGRDRAAREAERLDRLVELLAQRLAMYPPVESPDAGSASIDAATRRRLAELGYLDAGG